MCLSTSASILAVIELARSIMIRLGALVLSSIRGNILSSLGGNFREI